MMKLVSFFVLLILFGCSHILTEKKHGNNSLHESVDLDVEEVHLKNGMTILLLKNSKLPIFSLYYFYKVGSKNEDLGITGASHLLEHMMFKGGKKYGQNTIDFFIEGHGGSTNAYTTNDLTVYYENLPVKSLEKILDIEADRMENLLLDPQAFEKERAVVLEERKMRYENSPRGQIYHLMMKNLFKGTPYERSVIGRIPDLKSVSRDQIFHYFKKYYAPNNVTMVLVGDIDIPKTKKLARKIFSGIRPSTDLKKFHQETDNKNFKVHLKKDVVIHQLGQSTHPLFMLAYPTYPLGHPKGFALDMLSSIIGSGQSSALSSLYVLREKPWLSSVYSSHYQLEKNGLFFIGGEVLKEVNLESFRKDLQQNLLGFCDSVITLKNLQKVKNNYLIDLYSGLESNNGLAHFLGLRQVFYNDWRFYKKELEIYEQLTMKDIKEVCQETFTKKSVFVSVWNQNKEQKEVR